MTRRLIATVILTALFASDFAHGQNVAGQSWDDTDAKRLLVRNPIGSVIDVILIEKGSRIVTGRLVTVSGDSFEVENVKSPKLPRQKIAFADVLLVKKHGRSNTAKALIALGVGAAAIGGFLLALHFSFR